MHRSNPLPEIIQAITNQAQITAKCKRLNMLSFPPWWTPVHIDTLQIVPLMRRGYSLQDWIIKISCNLPTQTIISKKSTIRPITIIAARWGRSWCYCLLGYVRFLKHINRRGLIVTPILCNSSPISYCTHVLAWDVAPFGPINASLIDCANFTKLWYSDSASSKRTGASRATSSAFHQYPPQLPQSLPPQLPPYLYYNIITIILLNFSFHRHLLIHTLNPSPGKVLHNHRSIHIFHHWYPTFNSPK